MTTTIDLDDDESFDLATGVLDQHDLVHAPGWPGYSVVVYRYNWTAEEVAAGGDLPDDTTEHQASPMLTLDDVVAVLKAQP